MGSWLSLAEHRADNAGVVSSRGFLVKSLGRTSERLAGVVMPEGLDKSHRAHIILINWLKRGTYPENNEFKSKSEKIFQIRHD